MLEKTIDFTVNVLTLLFLISIHQLPILNAPFLCFFITQKQKVMHNLEGRFDILVTEICFVNAYVNVLYLQMI